MKDKRTYSIKKPMSGPNTSDRPDPPSPSDLISSTLETLRDADGTDLPLLDILSEHIVITNPKNTAVNDGVKAIETLAETRANEAKDDEPDND
ncbi:MAG: hypothetical protein U5R46_06135 [Gammaproteobacteria bacterium]|nr:hypothetical protein [Gammaproteobacteria bacterium]